MRFERISFVFFFLTGGVAWKVKSENFALMHFNRGSSASRCMPDRTGITRSIRFSEMSEEGQYTVFECAVSTNSYGKEPCSLLEELEQLAADEGHTDIHSFISSFLQFGEKP